METINIYFPVKMYAELSEIFAEYAMTVEDALLLFIKETVRLGRFPFNYTKSDLCGANSMGIEVVS